MCGLAGILTTPSPADALGKVAERMIARIVHRGPDDFGTWTEPSAGLALGFRRLSIIDLSAAGHQPMQSSTGRFSLVFNGEIYNYREIAEALVGEGWSFRGHSDTEVMLAAFERWGIAPAVERFIGMFAIAVWDSGTRQLSLIRDRLGIKPVYYYQHGGVFSFASELKAIVAGPSFDRTIDEEALEAYLRYLYVPAPRTIYRYARKLLPGHILTIRSAIDDPIACVPYWSADGAYSSGIANPFEGSDEDAVGELTRLLGDSVRLRMRADVPMGALLSGGIDSSTVVALMQAQGASNHATRTFSIGFPGTEHDEAAHARSIANVLGTTHTELSVTAKDALDVVPLLPEMFDEPFADPSEIPTYLVCKLARQHVTVALSGDGGDELFAGYERYVSGAPLIRNLERVPKHLRRLAGSGISALSTRSWNSAYRTVSPLLRGAKQYRLAGEKIQKLGTLLLQDGEPAMYRSLLSAAWQEPERYLGNGATNDGRVERLLNEHRGLPLLDRMMLVDQQTYLPDDLLAKVDRASMAVSLEARVPILDHRVVEFGWRLPAHFKVRDGRGKWILRQVLYQFVDRKLVDRPKVGFSVPIAEWLRGPLRDWGRELLFPAERHDWLRMDRVRETWERFQAGQSDAALGLWAILMFRAWEQRWQSTLA
jgi:asparagine synthase (glutamine-hydrolysing)